MAHSAAGKMQFCTGANGMSRAILRLRESAPLRYSGLRNYTLSICESLGVVSKLVTITTTCCSNAASATHIEDIHRE